MRVLFGLLSLIPLAVAAIALPQPARAEGYAVIRTGVAPIQATVVIGTPPRPQPVVVVPPRPQPVVVVRPRPEPQRVVVVEPHHRFVEPRRVIVVREPRHRGFHRFEQPERIVVR